MKKLLVKNDDYSLYAISISEEESNEIENIDLINVTQWNNIPLENIILFGDTSHISPSQLSKVIDSKIVKFRNGDKIDTINAYRCFIDKKHPFQNGTLVHHEDKLSSFKCLLGYMGYPEYIVIYKE